VILKVWTDGVDFKLLEADGKKLIGNCRRCGQCCINAKCGYLVQETLDDKPHARCGLITWIPAACALFPLPDEIQDCHQKAFHYE